MVLTRETARRPDGTLATTEKEARKVLRARRTEVDNHRNGVEAFRGPAAARLLFTKLLDDAERHAEVHALKSLPQIKSRVKRLKSYFMGYRALAVTHDVLLRYVQHRQTEGAANATINRELEVIGRAFVVGKVKFAPELPSLREDNARQGFFDRADFERVLSHIDDADVVDYLEWFYRVGMRPKETRSLTWAAYDRETSMLTLPGKDAKTGKARTLPLLAHLRPVFDRRITARRLDCEYIFHRGGQYMGEIRKTWLTACRKAGLAVAQERDGKTVFQALRRPYDLRRTAVRNMVRGGVDPAVAMKISGHRTRAIFDRYNIVDERDLAEAIEKTSAYVASLPTISNVIPMRVAEGRG
jgi:integrase